MIIEKTIEIPNNDESIGQKIISFWESRDVKFNDISLNEYFGNRGSLFGNMFSYNMKKLITSVNIKIKDNNEINCKLDINTKYQHITDWNKEYWQLELETFENILLNNDSLEGKWKVYFKKSKKMNFLWTIGIVALTIISLRIVKIIFF